MLFEIDKPGRTVPACEAGRRMIAVLEDPPHQIVRDARYKTPFGLLVRM
jgi:hypothetical protein